MIHAVRQCASGAEIVASYAAVRQRLYGRSNVVNLFKPKQPEPVAPIPLTYWERHKTYFDSHVHAYRRWKTGQPLKLYIKRRCREFGCSYREMVSSCRREDLTECRQLLMYEIKTVVKPDISYPVLGKLFNREHKTAWHAVNKMTERFERAAE